MMVADKEKIIDVFKYTFNKYGTYQSLKKDAELLYFFIYKPDEEIRQKNIIIYFSKWSPKTVRRHLKRLVEKKVITESSDFCGTHIFHPGYHRGMAVDMDSLARVILGDELYMLAKSCWEINEEEHDLDEQDYSTGNF